MKVLESQRLIPRLSGQKIRETPRNWPKMKTTIYLATDRGLTVIVGGDGNWRAKFALRTGRFSVWSPTRIKGALFTVELSATDYSRAKREALLGRNQPASLNRM